MILQPKKKRTNGPWWIFGAVGAFVLTEAKALLPLLKLGTMGGSVLSMGVSIGAYAFIAPLKLSVGVVILVLVHELGHVAAARRKGLPTSAPVFIPLIGAMVNMKRHPRDAVTEAYVAMGGPLVGTIGALAALAIGLLAGSSLWIAIAYVGILINLINLLPIIPLDGGKIVIAVSRWLWLLGLFVGLGLIIRFRMYLLLILWLLFAWDLYRKFMLRHGKGDAYMTWSSFQVPAWPQEGALFGLGTAGERRELAFTAYSNLDGKMKVELIWDEIGLHGVTSLPVQAIVRRAQIVRIDRRVKERKPYWVVRCQIDYELYESDAYYNVPAVSRWKFGIAYVLLTVFLLYLMHLVAGIGMPVAID